VLCKPKGCAAKEISAKDVPFEVGKFKFKYLTDLFEKIEKIQWRLWGKFKKI